MIGELMLLIFTTGLLIGFLAGAFIEWSRFDKASRQFRLELRSAYKEQEELRGIIYTQTQQMPIRQAKGK